MPESVYALHDFTPQVSDEIEFKVGDRIEVIEKDDLYGDGWWQVSFFSQGCRMASSGAGIGTAYVDLLKCLAGFRWRQLGLSHECGAL